MPYATIEVELGLVSEDQLPEIATSGLLEGYESNALANLAGQFGEPYDPVEIERLWTEALQELDWRRQDRRRASRRRASWMRRTGDWRLPRCYGRHSIVLHA
jgi:hypothetical protein